MADKNSKNIRDVLFDGIDGSLVEYLESIQIMAILLDYDRVHFSSWIYEPYQKNEKKVDCFRMVLQKENFNIWFVFNYEYSVLKRIYISDTIKNGRMGSNCVKGKNAIIKFKKIIKERL